MSSLLAGTARLIGPFALSACILAFAGGSAIAQTGGKIPEPHPNPIQLGLGPNSADGRNALYGDGWLDPPAGLRGPIKNHPDHPLQGNSDRGPGWQVTLAHRQPYGPDPQALGGRADARIERGGAVRQARDAVPGARRAVIREAFPVNCSGRRSRFYFVQNPKHGSHVWQRDSLTRAAST